MLISVTFDPDDVHTIGSIAREVGSDASNTGKWVARNKNILPDPIFNINISEHKKLSVWHGDDGRVIINQYKTLRGLRA